MYSFATEPSEDVYIVSEARKRAGSLRGDNTLASATDPVSNWPETATSIKGAARTLTFS